MKMKMSTAPNEDSLPESTPDKKVVLIDPDADRTVLNRVGNLMLLPAHIAELLAVATRDERLMLLGVPCRARHLSFEEACGDCALVRRSILNMLFGRVVEKAAP
jgi:hypothetical protein